MRVWYRTRARIRELSTPCPNLPQEAVERIVAHLVYTPSLLACSLTCHSWYIATVPHLHHTLVILNCRHYGEPKRQWPEPIRNAGRFGLLPLVKRVQVCRASIYHPHEGLHPRLFDRDTLRHFSALSNVQVFDSILETCHRHSDLSPSVNPKGPAGNFYSSSGYFSICKTLSSSIAHLPISRVSWRKSRRSLHYRDG